MSALVRLGRLSVLGLALVALSACDDPSKNKTKAVTTEATAEAKQAASAGAVAYAFDQSNSKIDWVGSKVTAKHEGSFKTFSGTISLVDQTPEKSSVTVEIETDSLFTPDGDKLIGHLKSADFFDVAKFPKVTFASTEVKKGGEKGATHTITGNLTLHGVSKSITFPATVKTGAGVDVDAEFAINRKDFGIVYAGKADDLIRDDVVIKLTIRSQKKG